jgi:hypothetical protein
VRDGRHRFSLGEPVDYKPQSVVVDLAGTTPGAPELIDFEAI